MAPPWEEGIGDDVLALVFTCCHPALSREARVALTLRMVGGLKTEEIARAFLVESRTVGQRISRAKKTLTEVQAPFAVPEGEELDARLPDVLEVDLPDLQRGLRGDAGRAVDAPGARRGRAPARPRARRARARGSRRCTGSWR